MAAIAGKRVRTTQPLPWQAQVIDWANPITQGMTLALSLADAGYGYHFINGQSILPFAAAATSVNTPAGTGGRTSSTSVPVISAPSGVFPTNNYSLFAYGTCTAGNVIQSALDMDNASTKLVQFRVDNGKVDLIPFASGGVVTGRATSAVIPVSEMSRGLAMGGTVSPTRSAVFANGAVTQGAAMGGTPVAPGSAIGLSIGARPGSNQSWATGGLSLVVCWNRTLTDAEMQSMCDNPWQIFKPQPRRLTLAYSASAAPTSASGSIAWTEADDAMSLAANVTNRAAAAWTEADDTAAASGLVTNSAAVAWTESGDTVAMTGTAAVPAQGQTGAAATLAWTEAGDTAAAIGVVVDRASLAWTEQDDAWSMTGRPDVPPSTTLSVRFDTLARDYGLKTTYFSN